MEKLPSIYSPQNKPNVKVEIDGLVHAKQSVFKSRIQPKTLRRRDNTVHEFLKSPEKTKKKKSHSLLKNSESSYPLSTLQESESIQEIPLLKQSSYQNLSFQTQQSETSHFVVNESIGYVCNSQIYALHIPSNQWNVLSKTIPSAGLRGYSMISYRGSLIKYGGYTLYKGTKSLSSSTHVYNIRENSWQVIEGMGEQPSPRFDHCAAKLGKHMIVFGGSNGHRTLKDLYTFDLQKYFWIKHEIANPNRRSQASLVPVIDESLKRNNALSLAYLTENKCFFAFQHAGVYLFGGIDEGLPKNDVYRLTGSAGALSWELVSTKGNKRPAPRYAHTTAAVGSFMYVFGGLDGQGSIYRDLFILNVINFRWTEAALKGVLPAYSKCSMQQYKNRIIVFGGNSQKYEVCVLGTDNRRFTQYV